MWYSVSECPISSLLETEMLRKIGDMVKKLKTLFSLFWHVNSPETLGHGCDLIGVCGADVCSLQLYMQLYTLTHSPN